MWEFETDPDFQVQLDWVDDFTREEIEPLDHLIPWPWDMSDPVRQALIPPLQDQVRERGLWAPHLGPELEGQGYGQVKLALLQEILGRTIAGPIVFGCQAPDSGNTEILAHYGTPELKDRFLAPLLRNDIVSAFSMTEPAGGSDPGEFTVRATETGDGWRLNGEKWFTSNARYAAFFIVLAVTDPDAPLTDRMSMFVVPADAPGVSIVRDVGLTGEAEGDGVHAYMRYDDVPVPNEHMLGGRGDGFVVAQTRLGGGRIHHAMRTVGLAQRALDMMAERAVSRRTKGEPLANKQLVQEMIAASWIELEQFRLLVLRTAWRIDKYQDYRQVRQDISAVKAAMPKVLHDIASRALQVHGSLGLSNELPLGWMVREAYSMALADGPTEVHKLAVAKAVLRHTTPTDSPFTSWHIPALAERARSKHAEALEAIDPHRRPLMVR